MSLSNRPSLKSLKKPSLGGIGPRKVAKVSDIELVKRSQLLPDSSLPLLIEPAAAGVDLISWGKANIKAIESDMHRFGGILFRGFDVPDVDVFNTFCNAVSEGGTLEYKERSSPRSQISGKVYTSTDYPHEQRIFLHNENSYAHRWPQKIFFYCDVEPGGGGETPLADMRKVLQRIDPEIRRKFAEKQVLYVRNFSELAGLPWQSVFNTDDPNEVEEYCSKAGYEIEWRQGSRLRTRRRGPAVVKHPRTGDEIWFNHATFFHISTMAEPLREGLLANFAREDLPNNTYYGDGSEIEAEVMDALRDAYEKETIAFPWQKNDLLMLDNMLTAHARAPFTPPRRILVSMSEAYPA